MDMILWIIAKLIDDLGTNEDFIGIVKLLHKNGIRVIVDGVFNHVGRDFPYFWM